MRAEIRKDRDTGKWTASRPRYGFGPGNEAKTFPSQVTAIRWATRSDTYSSAISVLELSYPDTDGVADAS